ncbi:MAG: hypothetical protein ACREAU_00930 [Nitrosopumilaceae archaeon]
MTLSVPPKGDADKRLGAHFSPLAVSAQDAPNMTVKVRAGSFWDNSANHLEFIGGNSPVFSAPGTLAKWVIVVVNSNALLQLVDGSPSANPIQPLLPINSVPLAAVFVNALAVAITNDMIFDVRPQWRTNAEVVPNLSTALSLRPTFTDLNALLDGKCDINGTPNTTFFFNKDHVGVSSTNVELVVERGAEPDVSILWNEILNQWEFTNDGSTFIPLGGLSTAAYYTKSDLDNGALDLRYFTETEVNSLFVAKAGGAMTGLLTLSGLPTTSFHAATKGYVDAAVGGGPFVSIAGGTMSGLLTLSGAPVLALHAANKDYVDVTTVSLGGDIMTGLLTLSGLPTLPGHAATKGYVDAAVAGVGLTYVDVSGDTMTGFLTLSANPTAPLHSATKGYVDSVAVGLDATLVNIAGDTMLGPLTLSGPPTIALHAASKAYVDGILVGGPFVPLAGGTMTGILTLSGPPTLALHAASKAYVDAAVGAGPFVLKAGDTMSGTLNMGGNKITILGTPTIATDAATKAYVDALSTVYVDVVGDTMTGPLVLSGAPTIALHAATKAYVDTSISALSTVYVDVTGDTMTGFLTLNANPTLALHAATKDYVDTTTVSLTGDTMTGFLTLNANPTLALHAATKDYVDTAVLSFALNDLSDVTIAGPISGDFLRFNGLQWVNIALIKAHITNFVEADYVHMTGIEIITGAKTFSDPATFSSSVVIGGDLTVSGTMTTVNSNNVNIGDNIITLNSDEAGAPTQNAGLEIERGTAPVNASLLWDETNDRWMAGLVGSEQPLRVGETNYELQAGTGGAGYTTGFSFATPGVGKASLMVFVNGIKQVEGALKAYTISAPTTVTFTAGNEPAFADDVEFYGI